MRHKCQSSLARCALRGQHPRWVVYATRSEGAHPGLWVLCRPLNGVSDTLSRRAFTYADAMAIARAGSTGEVPC